MPFTKRIQGEVTRFWMCLHCTFIINSEPNGTFMVAPWFKWMAEWKFGGTAHLQEGNSVHILTWLTVLDFPWKTSFSSLPNSGPFLPASLYSGKLFPPPTLPLDERSRLWLKWNLPLLSRPLLNESSGRLFIGWGRWNQGIAWRPLQRPTSFTETLARSLALSFTQTAFHSHFAVFVCF